MNNKRVGAQWEKEFCEILSRHGYWVHFITPDTRGAQPFDVIAVKNGRAMAVDCKTCVSNTFNINRLEDNQVMAFEKWIRCGNDIPMIAVLHSQKIYMIPYDELKKRQSINLTKGEFEV